ncbi:MAG: hypothetical protein AB8F74_16585 [Saprospiraceae bacterium]
MITTFRTILSHWIYFLLVLFLSATSVTAQKAQIEFFPRAEHLSSGFFRYIHQDDAGFIWVLGNRADQYDGYQFTSANGKENQLQQQYIPTYTSLDLPSQI